MQKWSSARSPSASLTKLGIEAPAIPDATPEGASPVEADLPDVSAEWAFEEYECIRDAAALQVWIDRINALGYVAVDTETTSLDEMRAELVGISLSVEPGQACYIPLIHKASATDDLFGSDDLAEGQMDADEALNMLKPVLEDDAVLKIGQNMKYDAKIFARHGVDRGPDRRHDADVLCDECRSAQSRHGPAVRTLS